MNQFPLRSWQSFVRNSWDGSEPRLIPLSNALGNGILKNEDGIVTALVSKDEAQACEIDELVEKRSLKALPAFIAAFTKRQDLSNDELDEVQQMIDRIRRGKQHERTLSKNRQYEHIRKLGCDCGFDIAVLLEKSSQMGKCSALGHCRCTDGFPVFD